MPGTGNAGMCQGIRPTPGRYRRCDTGPDVVPFRGSSLKPPMFRSGAELNHSRVRIVATWRLAVKVLPVMRARPAGLKWIDSTPGGSAVTALPSDMATGLARRLSVRAACVSGTAPRPSRPAVMTRRRTRPHHPVTSNPIAVLPA